MTQWLLEEAAFLALDVEEAEAQRRAAGEAEQQARLRAAAARQVGA